MRFQVPQFIETETKLIGPFTLKQFLWLASGGMIIFLFYMVLNRFVFFILAIPIGALSIALAFVRINETSFVNYILYSIMYFLNPKQFTFKKEADSLQEIIISERDNKN